MKWTIFALFLLPGLSLGAQCKGPDGKWYPYNDPRCSNAKPPSYGRTYSPANQAKGPDLSVERLFKSSMMSVGAIFQTSVKRHIKCALQDPQGRPIRVETAEINPPVDQMVFHSGPETDSVARVECWDTENSSISSVAFMSDIETLIDQVQDSASTLSRLRSEEESAPPEMMQEPSCSYIANTSTDWVESTEKLPKKRRQKIKDDALTGQASGAGFSDAEARVRSRAVWLVDKRLSRDEVYANLFNLCKSLK